MVNSTTEYWSVNGVSIQTLAFNVETWGGSLQAPPALRGSDTTIPFVPGQRLQRRMPTARTLQFSMWVQGSDADGKVPASGTQRTNFEKNWKMLRDLFWNQGEPVTLTRRWKEFGSSTVQTASATAIFAGGLSPDMTGRTRAVFSVDMLLPDPFFYGNIVTLTFPAGTASSITPTILGDYPTDRITITFRATRENPRLTNVTDSNSWVQFNTTVTGTNTAVLNVKDWTAREGSVNSIKKVKFQGKNKSWFTLYPGTQQLALSGTSGTGTATLTYQPRWI